MKALDLLAERLTDPKLSQYIKGVREEVRNGALLSDAFARQGVFPPHLRHYRAGRRAQRIAGGSDRTLHHLSENVAFGAQEAAGFAAVSSSAGGAGRSCLIVFLVTFVVPNFAELYTSMNAQLPAPTQILIAIGTTARSYVLLGFVAAGGRHLRVSMVGANDDWQRDDRPVSVENSGRGEVWLKYQVAQFSRVLGTLLIGGIPLLQALDTAADSLGTQVLKNVLQQAVKLVREGQSLSQSLCARLRFSRRCRST